MSPLFSDGHKSPPKFEDIVGRTKSYDNPIEVKEFVYGTL
jgi:hypothetical protein